MSDETFSYNLRVLVCPQCGGPVKAESAGGIFACPFCGVKMVLASRPQKAPEPSATKSSSEAVRMEKLRAQDGKRLLPPPDMRHLLRAGQLSADQAEEAFREWQSVRTNIIAASTPILEERLYFLTFLLSQHFTLKKEDSRKRAVLETASELLTDTRYAQEARCMLARAATVNKEFDAAEKWLSQCDPNSEDLHMDTAYRTTCAHLATFRCEWDVVLRHLGQTIDEIPIADEADAICGVMRANALEQKGQTETARTQIRQLMGTLELGAAAINSIVTVFREQGVNACPMSATVTAAKSTGRSHALKHVWTMMKVLTSAGSLTLLVLYFARNHLAIAQNTSEDFLPLSIVLGVLGLGPFLGGFLLRLFLGGVANREKLLKEGLAGKAQIVSITPTGWTINDVQQYKLSLMVSAPGITPFAADLKVLMPDDQKSGFGPGVTIGAKIDPKKHSRFTLEM